MNANGDVITPVEIYGSNVQLPIQIQSHRQQTIQLHSDVNIAANGKADSAWIDLNGVSGTYRLIFNNDAATASEYNLLWSNDGATLHGAEYGIQSTPQKEKGSFHSIKARYFKLQLSNLDTAAHTMNAWIFISVQ